MLCNEYPVFCTLEFQRTILFNFTLQLTFVDVVINRNGIIEIDLNFYNLVYKNQILYS